MADNQADSPVHDDEEDGGAEIASSRSRASSIISTGTKFSISTLPQDQFPTDDTPEGNAALTPSPRPASPRSITPSLPPYSAQPPRIQTTPPPSPSPPANHPPTTPTTSDPENTLSKHYGRVVRTIDENHARQLARIHATHAQELAATREAIDHAYRTEHKARRRSLERARQDAAAHVAAMEASLRDARAGCAALEERVRSLGAAHEEGLARARSEEAERVGRLREQWRVEGERARNGVEDLWEGRWNDRRRLAAEEVRERDARWLRLIGGRHPEESLDELRGAMEMG